MRAQHGGAPRRWACWRVCHKTLCVGFACARDTGERRAGGPAAHLSRDPGCRVCVRAQHRRGAAQVDLLGVVTATGPLGSVKRQRDGTELARRDLTIADQRRARAPQAGAPAHPLRSGEQGEPAAPGRVTIPSRCVICARLRSAGTRAARAATSRRRRPLQRARPRAATPVRRSGRARANGARLRAQQQDCNSDIAGAHGRKVMRARADGTAARARSGKTVTVTLWGQAAEEAGAELEALTHALVSISACRVTDYNGAPRTRTRSGRAAAPPRMQALDACARGPLRRRRASARAFAPRRAH